MEHPDLLPDCGRIQSEFAGYLYGELVPEARASVARHLEACPACREELAALQETRRLLAHWETPPVGEDPRELARSIVERAGQEVVHAGRRARLVRWSAMLSGAAAAVLFTLSLLQAQVSLGDGRFQLSFSLPGAPASAPGVVPGVVPVEAEWRETMRSIAAEEAALRTIGLERNQQEQLLRIAQAVDYALAQNQQTFDTRFQTFGREAARTDLETRRALTEFASYLPVSSPAPTDR